MPKQLNVLGHSYIQRLLDFNPLKKFQENFFKVSAKRFQIQNCSKNCFQFSISSSSLFYIGSEEKTQIVFVIDPYSQVFPSIERFSCFAFTYETFFQKKCIFCKNVIRILYEMFDIVANLQNLPFLYKLVRFV